MRIVPVILCGGAGSRLWPISREQHPKLFIRFQDNQSLLQKAFIRGASLPSVQDILFVTSKEFFFKVVEEISVLGNSSINPYYILEPMPRNTAAAIASATLHVKKQYGDDALMLILTADHLIQNQLAFQEAVREAVELAQTKKLVTFGIRPTTPHTGYGYIEADNNTVLRFVEKPKLELAEQYLASGNFLWNSGMFLSSAHTMYHAMEEHCPDILHLIESCYANSQSIQYQGIEGIELQQDFSLVQDLSIDYAVMEHAKNIAVVPCQIGWSDIGSWTALEELAEPSSNGNTLEGDVMLHEVTNCYIKGSDRLIGAVGVDNLLIVDTPDALLVASKDKAQDVKQIYSQLKDKGHEAYKLHRTVYRPWGTYTVLEQSERFKIKRIVVKPGASLSLQMHHHRSEHWIVVSGMAKVVNGKDEFFIRTNESTYIPAGCLHRLENPGILDLVIIEVQSGDYLGEDDIVRYQDNYGRH